MNGFKSSAARPAVCLTSMSHSQPPMLEADHDPNQGPIEDQQRFGLALDSISLLLFLLSQFNRPNKAVGRQSLTLSALEKLSACDKYSLLLACLPVVCFQHYFSHSSTAKLSSGCSTEERLFATPS